MLAGVSSRLQVGYSAGLQLDRSLVHIRPACHVVWGTGSVRRHAPVISYALSPVLERVSDEPAVQQKEHSRQQPASTLPATWSERDLDDEQMSHELKVRRQRSHSLAQTSEAAEAEGPPQLRSIQPEDDAGQAGKARPGRRRKGASRTRSYRGASRQGHTATIPENHLASSSEPLTQAQEIEVCKAIQVNRHSIVLAPLNCRRLWKLLQEEALSSWIRNNSQYCCYLLQHVSLPVLVFLISCMD